MAPISDSSQAIPLFTSIPPKWVRPSAGGRDFGRAWFNECIASWNASGFRPISLNSPAEINGLSMLPVEFQTIPAERSRPLISDLLGAAKGCRNRIVGIINADCMMIPQLNLPTILNQFLDDGVVIVERLNISQETLRPTGKHCWGFDAFFFTLESLDRIRWSDEWRLGSTWWDYCFPLAFLAASKKVRTLPSPALLHLDHERAWNRSEWLMNGAKVMEIIRSIPMSVQKTMPQFLPSVENEEAIERFSSDLFDWLRNRDRLYTPEHESRDELAALTLNALGSSPQPPVVAPRKSGHCREFTSSLRGLIRGMTPPLIRSGIRRFLNRARTGPLTT